MQVPQYLIPYVLCGTVAIIVAVLFALNQSLSRSGLADHERRGIFRRVAGLLVGWFFLALILARLQFFRGAATRTPTLEYGLLLPIVIGIWLGYKSRAIFTAVQVVPQSWMVGVQLYRALGVIFLVLYAQGLLPGVFAWPAGAGDIAVGLLAPFVGLAYIRNPASRAGLVRAWNLFGASRVSAIRFNSSSCRKLRYARVGEGSCSGGALAD